jgi:hypothetical protein
MVTRDRAAIFPVDIRKGFGWSRYESYRRATLLQGGLLLGRC